MKTLDEALQTVVQTRFHPNEPAEDDTQRFIKDAASILIENERKYALIYEELKDHSIVQEFLYLIFCNFGENYELMLNAVFYYGIRVGMEMEKSDNWKEKL